MMKKICLLIVCILLFGSISACRFSDKKPSDISATDIPPQNQNAVIPLASLSNYKIIYPEKSGSTLDLTIKEMTKLLSANLNMVLSIQDDYYNDKFPDTAIGEYEILLGSTNRPESQQFLAKMKYHDFGYEIVGNKLIIAGYTDETTAKALSRFITLILRELTPNSEVFFSNQDSYCYRASYPYSSALIDEQALESYQIVYPAKNTCSELDAAKLIQNFVADQYGHYIRIVNDSKPVDGNLILVGDVAFVTEEMHARRRQACSSFQYYILSANDGKLVWIHAEQPSGLFAAAVGIRNLLTPTAGDAVTISLKEGISKSYGSTVLSTMSFNILYSNPSGRSEQVTTLIKKYMPDTFGVQEATPKWMNELEKKLGDTYAWVGTGRYGSSTSEGNEYNAVFYRKDKFRLIDSATKWLSTSPDKPSRLPDSPMNRIVTYAVLQNLEDDTIFVHANTHLHHTSGDDAVRLEQSKILVKQLSSLFSKYPVILTGDLNSEASSTPCQHIVSCGYVNASEVAMECQKAHTNGNKTIDYIFFSKNAFIVNKYQVCNESINGSAPSDHFPILAKYILLS